MTADPAMELLLDERPAHVGSFAVGRVLPSLHRKLVGPFIFVDHMGPAEIAAGQGMEVLPHPHIGLATVTYLLDGSILHRDSVGSVQQINPGDINWMTAGRGIAHSERTPPELRTQPFRAHGLQLWVALPNEHEEIAPEFHHHAAASLPIIDVDGAAVRLLAGTAYGTTSPVRTFSPLFYVDVTLPAGASLPLPTEHAERAVYVLDGEVSFESSQIRARQMAIFNPGGTAVVRAEVASRMVMIGGAPVGERHIWWNFVSSSRQRIQQAAEDWRQGRFPRIPRDDVEFIPAPDDKLIHIR